MAIKASATITLSSIRDLQSCTRYYLLQSSTLAKPSKPTAKPPGGSWVTAEPAYTAGSTNSLYFCDLNVFSDGTFVYSDVSLSSSYEAAKAAWNKARTAQDAIDGLQVGGRNLVLGSAEMKTEGLAVWALTSGLTVSDGVVTFPAISTAGWRSAIGITRKKLADYLGQKITISADVRAETSETAYLTFELRVTPTTATTARVKYKAAGHYTPSGNEWQRVSCTFDCTEAALPSDDGSHTLEPDVNGIALGIHRYGTEACEVRRIKAEIGTMSTDWTPAPEDVENAIDAAQSAADQALANAECIVGTQTASTNAWTGRASFPSLQDGQVIMYWLPYAGTSTAATLNLTLSGGGTTGAKAVYINATTRCTTHIAAGNMVQMVYRSNVTIGTATYTGWWISRALNDNTYDRIRFNNVIKAKTAISASRLIVGDSGGFFHLAAGSVFDVDKPSLWAGSAITAAATGTNNYLSYPSCTLRNNTTSTWTATQYETLYLAGTLAGNIFTVASENWLTTAPSTETLTYISLGYMYSTYQMYFYPEHPMYRLVDGTLTAISQIAHEAQVAAGTAQATADATRADFRRVVRIDDDGLHVGDNLSNGEVLIDSESVNVVLGGKKYSKFAGSYVQFGNYQLRRSSDGGLVFKLA